MRTIQVKLIEQPGGCFGCVFHTTQECNAPRVQGEYAPPCKPSTQFVIDRDTPVCAQES